MILAKGNAGQELQQGHPEEMSYHFEPNLIEFIFMISGRDITRCSCCGCSKQLSRYVQMYSIRPNS